MNRTPRTPAAAHPRLALVGRDRQAADGPGVPPTRPGHGEEYTGSAPAPPHGARAPAGPAEPEAALRAELHERTADLQRLKAEYDNYRKRVHRDRQAVAEIAVANVLTRLLPVLDALTEATDRDGVTGGFRPVADALETELGALGLQSVAVPGAPFDPTLHKAVGCTRSDAVAVPVCSAVLRQGYRVGDQLLRAAEVVVTVPSG
ncbi:nucleotide exchange factor GrpE [Streptomyces sp. NPDC056411]|uniref:nucleotide exchange factor GrpE n=1 Tax=Streptomyces sp. NPDC056411 TaxID=3345813 RepID=UPI0035E130D5